MTAVFCGKKFCDSYEVTPYLKYFLGKIIKQKSKKCKKIIRTHILITLLITPAYFTFFKTTKKQ